MTASKKQPRWKRVQSKKKSRENRFRVVMGLVFLGLIFSLIVTGFLWKKAKDSLWDGRSRLAVAVNLDHDLLVKVLIPEQKRLVEFKIPGQTMVQVPFGYGEYQAEKIFKLGSLDGYGGKLLRRSMQDLLGINVTGYKHKTQTNLSWLDQARWQGFVWFKLKKTSRYDLAGLSLLNLKKLSDDKQVYKVSIGLVDELVNKELFDQEIVNEALSIAIVNSTKVVGEALNMSRLVANLGGEVSLITNIDEPENSKIMVQSKEMLETKTVKSLVRALEIREAQVSKVDQYRSEVVVVIGRDYVSLK